MSKQGRECLGCIGMFALCCVLAWGLISVVRLLLP